MSESKSKGPVLRRLMSGGDTGPAVRVITNRADWETRMVGQGEHSGVAVGQSLVAFQAESYQEVGVGSDLWDFHVDEGGQKFHVYLAGSDIFMLYVPFAVV